MKTDKPMYLFEFGHIGQEMQEQFRLAHPRNHCDTHRSKHHLQGTPRSPKTNEEDSSGDRQDLHKTNEKASLTPQTSDSTRSTQKHVSFTYQSGPPISVIGAARQREQKTRTLILRFSHVQVWQVEVRGESNRKLCRKLPSFMRFLKTRYLGV